MEKFQDIVSLVYTLNFIVCKKDILASALYRSWHQGGTSVIYHGSNRIGGIEHQFEVMIEGHINNPLLWKESCAFASLARYNIEG